MKTKELQELLMSLIEKLDAADDEHESHSQSLGLTKPIVDLQLVKIFAEASNVTEKEVYCAACYFVKDEGKIMILDQNLSTVGYNPFKLIDDLDVPDATKEVLKQGFQEHLFETNAHELEKADVALKSVLKNLEDKEDGCDCELCKDGDKHPDVSQVTPESDSIN